VSPWLLVVAGYLLGSVPASYIAGRLARGIDLREHGSGNLGATNTFRVLGAKVAAPVMVFDIVKGFVPAWFFPLWDSSADWRWALAYGAAAIVGHVFSLYMKFRGGKGVATATGVFLALAPAAVGGAFLVWLATLWLSRMVSAASILAALVLLPLLWLTSDRWEVQALGAAIAAFVVFAHRANVGRILRGEEHRFGKKAAAEHPAEATVAAAAVAAEGEDAR
jgi:glycerol-3-phosphate acyltransferase PlsY